MSHPADTYMPFYGADFFESERVAAIEPLAKWFYWCLLWRQWRHGSIPSDLAALRNIFPEFGPDLERLWPQVRQFFESIGSGRMANERCTFERKLAEERIDKASDKAKAMNAKRWASHQKAVSDPVGVHKEILQESCVDPVGVPVREGMGWDGNGKESPPSAGATSAPVPKKARGRSGPRPPTSIEAIWYSERAKVYPQADGKLTRKQSIDLNGLHGQHGPERLRGAIAALFRDQSQFGRANANPSYLASHWDAVTGSLFTAPAPPHGLAPEKLDRIRRVLQAGEPADKKSLDYDRWTIAKQEVIDHKLTPEDLNGRH